MHYKFKRQVPIAEFIVDFVCFEQKLIIEIDGGQYAENSEDLLRDAKLIKMGFRVVRFWNNDVIQNLEGVLMTILEHLQATTPLPSPLVEQLSGRLNPQADKSPLIPQGEREL